MRYRVWIRHRSGGQDWKIVPASSRDEAELYARKRWGHRFLSVADIYDGVNAKAAELAHPKGAS